MNRLELAQRCADKMYEDDKASQGLGMKIEIPEAGAAIATMRVREDMVNGHDVCHGGFIFTLADSAFAFACNAYDEVTVAASAKIDFTRPVMLGDELRAVASEDYRGKKTGFYTIKVVNQDNDLVAMFRGRSASLGETMLGPVPK